MDTVSNGGFLSFSSAGILSPLPGELSRSYGPCDYDVRHNFNANYVYELPIKVRQDFARPYRERLAGFRNPVLAQRASLLGLGHAVFGKWKRHRAGRRAAVRQRGSRRAALRAQSHSGRDAAGNGAVAQSQCICFHGDPSTGACVGGDDAQNCQFGNLGRNALRGPDFFWSDLYITKMVPLNERLNLRFEVQMFNVFNHVNFALPSMVLAGIPGKPSTQTGFGALTYATSPPTGLLGVGLGGDSAPRMIALQAHLEF
jgi:hypothetical protein